MNKLNSLILLWEKFLKNKPKKTIEYQGKKQIDALADLKPKEIKPRKIKPNKCSDYFLDKMAEIRNSFEIDFNNLKYTFKERHNGPTGVTGFKVLLHVFKSIHNGDITLEDPGKDQIKLKSDLGHIKQENPNSRSVEQNNVINNVTNLSESREKVIQMFNNLLKICLEIFINQNKELNKCFKDCQ